MSMRLTVFNGYGSDAATENLAAGKTGPDHSLPQESELRTAFNILYDQIKYQGVSLQHVRDALAERIMLYTKKSKVASESLGLPDNPLRRKRGEMMDFFRMAGNHTQRQQDAYGDTIDVLCKAIAVGQFDWTDVKNTLVAFACDDYETKEAAIQVLYKGGTEIIPPASRCTIIDTCEEKTLELEDRTARAMGIIFEAMRSPGSALGFRDVRDSIAVKMIERVGHSQAARELDMGRSTMYRIQQSNAELLETPANIPQKTEKYQSAIDTLCDALQMKQTTLKAIEQESVEFMLSYAGTKTDCAYTLGMGRSTFYRKLQLMKLG